MAENQMIENHEVLFGGGSPSSTASQGISADLLQQYPLNAANPSDGQALVWLASTSSWTPVTITSVQGPRGIPGPLGPQGQMGLTGVTGARGTTGIPGPTLSGFLTVAPLKYDSGSGTMSIDSTSMLQSSSNLADLTNLTASRANLGLGSAATHSASDFLVANGSGASLTNLNPANIATGTAAISISGNASGITGGVAQSQVTGLSSTLAGKLGATGDASAAVVMSASGTASRSLASRFAETKNVLDMGAVADTRSVTDAVSTISSTTFTSATAAFTSADAGKIVMVSKAGNQTNGYSITGTVAAVNSATSITISGTFATAVKAATGLRLTLGTDNTAFIQATLDAAPAYSTVVIPPGSYGVNNAIYVRRDNITVDCRGTITLIGHTSIGGLLCIVNSENVTWRGGVIDCADAGGENAINVSGNFNTAPATTINASKFCRNVRVTDVTVYRARFDGKYVFSLSPATGTFQLGETVNGPGGFSCVINELFQNSATNFRILTYALAGNVTLTAGAAVNGATSGAAGTVSFAQVPAKGGKGCTVQYAARDCFLSGLKIEDCDIGISVEAPRTNVFGKSGAVSNLNVSDITIRNASRCGIWLYQGASPPSVSMLNMGAVFSTISMVDVAYLDPIRPEVGIGPTANGPTFGFGAISMDRAANVKMRGVKIHSQYAASILQGEGSFLDIEFEADCATITDPVNFNVHGVWAPGDTSPGQGFSENNKIKGTCRSRYLNDPSRFPLTWGTASMSIPGSNIVRASLSGTPGAFQIGESLTITGGGLTAAGTSYYQDDGLLYIAIAAAGGGGIANGATVTGATSGATASISLPGFRTLNVANATGTFSVAATLTGSISAAAAIIRQQPSLANLIVEGGSGAFRAGETLTASSGGTCTLSTVELIGNLSRSLFRSEVDLTLYGMRYPGGLVNLVGQTNSSVLVRIYDADGDRIARGLAISGFRFSTFARENVFTAGGQVIDAAGILGASGIDFIVRATQSSGRTLIRTQGGTNAAEIGSSVFQTSGSAYNSPHLGIGAYRVWIDANGRPRVSNGAPGADSSGRGFALLDTGTTANRPTGLAATDAGYLYLDTTLGQSIQWSGTNWIDPLGNLPSAIGKRWLSGNGAPEGVVTAPTGSLYLRGDGGANTTLYVKESGVGNTGWIAK